MSMFFTLWLDTDTSNSFWNNPGNTLLNTSPSLPRRTRPPPRGTGSSLSLRSHPAVPSQGGTQPSRPPHLPSTCPLSLSQSPFPSRPPTPSRALAPAHAGSPTTPSDQTRGARAGATCREGGSGPPSPLPPGGVNPSAPTHGLSHGQGGGCSRKSRWDLGRPSGTQLAVRRVGDTTHRSSHTHTSSGPEEAEGSGPRAGSPPPPALGHHPGV